MKTSLLGKTLLLVDDRPENLLSLEALLEASGATLHKAFSGNEALKWVYTASRKPDCILLDVQMPQMSGYEVATLLKGLSATAAIPVVFVTASEADNTVVDPEFADVLSQPVFVHKPLTQQAVLAALERAVQQKA